jgi:hypothetical protein
LSGTRSLSRPSFADIASTNRSAIGAK